jgi:hypothetical protein
VWGYIVAFTKVNLKNFFCFKKMKSYGKVENTFYRDLLWINHKFFFRGEVLLCGPDLEPVILLSHPSHPRHLMLDYRHEPPYLTPSTKFLSLIFYVLALLDLYQCNHPSINLSYFSLHVLLYKINHKLQYNSF